MRSKNVVIITGSARRGGNTELLAKAYAKGAKKAGHKVEIFEAAHKNIKGCRACNKCYTKDGACVFGDDFNQLAPLVEKADVLVFATALYWFNFSSHIKAAIDKIYSLYVGKRDVNVSEAALLVCAETDEMKDFEGIVSTYDLITSYLSWDDRGKILVPSVNKVGDIEKTDALRKAEEAGEEL